MNKQHNSQSHATHTKNNSQVFVTQDKPKIQSQPKDFDYWLRKNKYYHNHTNQFYKLNIPHYASILHIGCKNGYLLDFLRPSFAVGVDTDESEILSARERYPRYQFFVGMNGMVHLFHRFDYIILPFTTMEVDDVHIMLTHLHRFCHPGTRIILKTYSYLWEPILLTTQWLGLKRPTQLKHWLSSHDINTFLYLAGFDTFRKGTYMLMPMWIPWISWLLNHIFAHIPIIKRLCLHRWVIARPVRMSYNRLETKVSVIVTCRNERGNIEAALQRIPSMGSSTEIIFVEGGSHDGTWDEILRVIKKYPDKKCIALQQNGKGKGDAVRKGFAHAQGDILMILDGDLTVPPEELPKFFEALVSGKGEFINGSRLVYGMERGAMRFLNIFANYCFGLGFSWLLGQRIKDTLCGTKVLFKKDYERIARERGFLGFEDPFGDFDLLFGAAKLNLKIIDMPISYKNRTYGKSNIRRFLHGWYLLRMWLRALFIFKG